MSHDANGALRLARMFPMELEKKNNGDPLKCAQGFNDSSLC